MSRYIAAYDVSGNRRRRQVARVLDGFGERRQRSVYELWLDEADHAELRRRVGPLLEPDDEVIMAWGSFISYWLRGVEMGANVARVPLLNYTHDLDAIFDAVTPDTRIIFCCNPNNPTGAVYDAATLEAIARIAERHGLVVFSDEIYDGMVYDDAEFFPIAPMVKNTLCGTFRGLSKVYRACGFRV
mgnify:CR=1 FL=1